MNNAKVGEVERYKYLESVLQMNGGFVEDMIHYSYRIVCEWMNWKKMSVILYAKSIPIRLKDKFYSSESLQ